MNRTVILTDATGRSFTLTGADVTMPERPPAPPKPPPAPDPRIVAAEAKRHRKGLRLRLPLAQPMTRP